LKAWGRYAQFFILTLTKIPLERAIYPFVVRTRSKLLPGNEPFYNALPLNALHATAGKFGARVKPPPMFVTFQNRISDRL
jgi:hypothetical protein